jgi:exodeoxyribonuclease VII large subunit
VYLSLKDEAAQIRAVIWRNTAARLKFDVRDGLEVVAANWIERWRAIMAPSARSTS